MERMFCLLVNAMFSTIAIGIAKDGVNMKPCSLHIIRIIVFVLGSYLCYVIISLGYHIARLSYC